jgi:hypothetical protein
LDHLLVLTLRPQEQSPEYSALAVELARRGSAEEIELDPLGVPAIAEIVETMTGSRLGSEQLDHLIELSDGNPFHVVELVRTSGGEFDSAEVTTPRPVEHHVLARLAALEPETRQAASRAAVIGRDVPVDQLAGDAVRVPLGRVHSIRTTAEGADLVVFRVHETGQPERTLVDAANA